MTEKTMYGDGQVTLKFLDADAIKEFLHNVSSVHCFPIQDGKVLFTVNPRGIDIIGGHVEKGETIEEAFMRESMEEASMVPKTFKVIGGIEVDNSENPKAIEKGYPVKGIQLFYAVTEFELQPFTQTHECTDRIFVEPNEISSKHHKWLNTHQIVLDEALNSMTSIKSLKKNCP